MSVKERLIEFIKSNKMSNRAFEKELGLSNGYINNITSSIGIDKLQRITLRYPELNLTWLLTGEGEKLKKYPTQTINDQTLHEESVPLRLNSMEGLIEICLNLQKDNIFLKAQLERKDNSLDDLNFKLERRIAENEALKVKIKDLDDQIKIRDATIRGKDIIIESKLGAGHSVSQKGEKTG